MVYLDHAAATPLLPAALDAMTPYFLTDFFNPSSPYLPAKKVREAYEAAKGEIAHAIGAKGVDLIMTAGATESINLAFTVLDQLAAQQPPSHPPQALALATEHAAVLACAQRYPHALLKVNRQGLLELADLRRKLTDEVALVSIGLANNELGTIQPFAEISAIIQQVRQDRLRRGIKLPLYLHSDASQALNLIDLNVARMGIDLMTLNAAKCGGPKGVGALYINRGVKLQPRIYGGGQERGLRSGTENVPGVIGFAAALKFAKAHQVSARKAYQRMAQVLHRELAHTSIIAQMGGKVNRKVPDSVAQGNIIAPKTPDLSNFPPEPLFLGSSKHQLANFVPVCFPGLDAERLIYKLEARGILVSTGAACAANKGSKSHVLAAIGLSEAEIAGSLRISLGSTNTLEQIRAAAPVIAATVAQEYQRIGGAHA